VLDSIIGDPIGFPHPIRWIGSLISTLTNYFLSKTDNDKTKRQYGLYMVIIVITVPALITAFILCVSYSFNPVMGVVFEAVLTYYFLAAKSLYTESMKVYRALKEEGLAKARYAVSMIVGRDTEALDETGVAKAAIETVAENTSDGVIAPMIYLAIGGPILGVIYKSINTMDSMVGYKNDKYIDFGRCAAHLDDIVNYIPARLSAYLMIFGCNFLGKNYNAQNARRIYYRDRYNHASPNSAQTESVCAGALGIRLAGPASYFGKKLEKPYIGDALRPVEIEDIKRANKLMYITTFICELICIGAMTAILVL